MRLFGSVGDCAEQLVESVLVNRSEIRTVCRPECGVCDVGPHNHRDLRCNFLLDANCRQAGRVFSVCLVLGVGAVCRSGRGSLGDRLFLDVALLDRRVGFLFC